MSKFKTQVEKSEHFYKYETQRLKEYKHNIKMLVQSLPKEQMEEILHNVDWAIKASSIKSRNYTILKQLKNEQD
jgi:hypothetical protein